MYVNLSLTKRTPMTFPFDLLVRVIGGEGPGAGSPIRERRRRALTVERLDAKLLLTRRASRTP